MNPKFNPKTHKAQPEHQNLKGKSTVRPPSSSRNTFPRHISSDKNELNKCKPWSDLFTKSKNDTNVSYCKTSISSNSTQTSFNLFNPLRTLRFLVNELQETLSAVLPNNKAISKILTEITNAIKRLQENNKNLSDELYQTKLEKITTIRPEQRTELKSNATCSKCTEYTKSNIDIVKDRINEEFNLKFRDLELAYTELRNEKFIVEKELSQYKTEVTDMMEKIAFIKKTQEENSNNDKNIVEQLTKKCNGLQNEISKMQENASKTEHLQYVEIEKLNSMLQKTLDEKLILDRSLDEHGKQFIFLQMEKEKLLILLKSREMHLNAVESEILNVSSLARAYVDTIGINIKGLSHTTKDLHERISIEEKCVDVLELESDCSINYSMKSNDNVNFQE